MPMHEVFVWMRGEEVGATSNPDQVPAGATVYRILIPAFENCWAEQVYLFEKVAE